MDVRRLDYFIVTAEEGSISRAAEKLHITQPPLTRHIQSLEDELGAPLFRRTNWGVELTQAGAELLRHARNISAHVELASEKVRRVARGQAGRIDIGVFGSAMLNIIPRILSAYARVCPDVHVVLHNAPKGRQIEALHQGRILIAFDRYLPDSPQLRTELVCREALWVAVNERNPLSAQASVALAELKNEPLIGEQDQSVFFVSQRSFRDRNFEPLIVHKAADMMSAVVMVSGGFGSALVPESALNLQLPGVVFRPLAAADEVLIDLHCAYRNDEQSPLLPALLQCVHAYGEQRGVRSDGAPGASEPAR